LLDRSRLLFGPYQPLCITCPETHGQLVATSGRDCIGRSITHLNLLFLWRSVTSCSRLCSAQMNKPRNELCIVAQESNPVTMSETRFVIANPDILRQKHLNLIYVAVVDFHCQTIAKRSPKFYLKGACYGRFSIR